MLGIRDDETNTIQLSDERLELFVIGSFPSLHDVVYFRSPSCRFFRLEGDDEQVRVDKPS